jgi:hypothetical protein
MAHEAEPAAVVRKAMLPARPRGARKTAWRAGEFCGRYAPNDVGTESKDPVNNQDGQLRSDVSRARVVKRIQAASVTCVTGQCLCGDVRFEIDFPARWAWHDHSDASRRAHGAAYATYVGSWRSRFRVKQGSSAITRFEDKAAGTVRSFCARCGTPLFYEQARSPHMINIPRALFRNRTGREPRYHIAIEESQEWAYSGEPLAPLKGFPGIMWERRRRRTRLVEIGGPF